MYTNQSAFNKVWKKFIINKAPFSVNNDGNCVNLTHDNKRCGAACLVPVKFLKGFGFEGGFTDAVDDYLVDSGLAYSFVRSIRECHDSAAGSQLVRLTTFDNEHQLITSSKIAKSKREAMKRNLKLLAKVYNLKVPV